jgi:hypothetical protein
VQEQAAAALRVLSANADNQTRIVEEVITPPLSYTPCVFEVLYTGKFKYYWY